MYRLVFVDDESIIREGISSCISWDDLGFELVKMFENGQQTIDYLREHPVDVVVSDIKMPKIDGLELSKLIYEEFPDMMVLLLSGYDDFEYAQEALKYHVSEFLLKPITAEEFTKVLITIREMLDAQRQEREHQEELQEKLDQSFPLLRERFFYRLISGKLDNSDILQKKTYFQWNDLQGLYQIIVIGIPESWSDLNRLSLFEQVKGILGDTDDLLTNREEHIVLLLQDPSCTPEYVPDSTAYIREVQRRGYHIAKRIFSFANNNKRVEPVSIGCGEVITDNTQIVISYRGAENALDYLRVLGVSKILHISEIRDKQPASPEEFNLLAANLIEQLKTGSRGETEKALEAIFSFFERSYLTLHEASLYLIRLHAQLQDFAQGMNLFAEENISIPYQTDFFVSINQARGFFTKVIYDIENRIQEKRHDVTMYRIDKAEAIISRRYIDKNFSLPDICDELFLSTSQFSYLFKEGTGKTFVEYLTAYRINQAKVLLKDSPMRVYEIADKVGFSDPRYFSIIFKKLAGKTPLEYRRSLES